METCVEMTSKERQRKLGKDLVIAKSIVSKKLVDNLSRSKKSLMMTKVAKNSFSNKLKHSLQKSWDSTLET